MKKVINKYSTFGLLMLAACAAMFFVAVYPFNSPSAPPPFLPNPNGYDDFLKAAQLVVDVPPEVQNGDLAKLAEAVEQNKEALRLVRLGLSRECRVSNRYVIKDGKGWYASFERPGKLEQALCGEGTLHERRSRFDAAATSYLDCVRLGTEIDRGGTLLDSLSAKDLQDLGIKGIRRIRPKLSRERQREVICSLQVVADHPKNIVDIIKRTNEIDSKLLPWWFRFYDRVRWYHTITESAVDRHWTTELNRQSAELRLFIVDLAIQLHRLESGHLPARLRDLMPASISTIPEDPFNPAGFIYRTNATGYLLYSIGPDGKDDDGAKLVIPSGKRTPTGDILVEP